VLKLWSGILELGDFSKKKRFFRFESSSESTRSSPWIVIDMVGMDWI